MIFKTEKDRHTAYKNTFSNNQALRVLVDILGTLGFWDTIQPPGLTAEEHNVLSLHAKKILERCGFWKPGNYEAILRNMLGQTPPKKKHWWDKWRK